VSGPKGNTESRLSKSPTVEKVTVSLFVHYLSLGLRGDIILGDVRETYLNAPMPDEGPIVLIHPPVGHEVVGKGFVKRNPPGFWRLCMAMYGLREAGRLWNNTLNDAYVRDDWRRSVFDPSLLSSEVLSVVHVDDLSCSGSGADDRMSELGFDMGKVVRLESHPFIGERLIRGTHQIGGKHVDVILISMFDYICR